MLQALGTIRIWFLQKNKKKFHFIHYLWREHVLGKTYRLSELLMKKKILWRGRGYFAAFLSWETKCNKGSKWESISFPAAMLHKAQWSNSFLTTNNNNNPKENKEHFHFQNKYPGAWFYSTQKTWKPGTILLYFAKKNFELLKKERWD